MSGLQLGVLGENISYSLSPRIFEWVFRESGVNGEYHVFDLPHGQVREFLHQDSAWHGLSVTTPYKELAFESCSDLSPAAQAARAVNVLTRTKDGIHGDNSDVAGFQFALNLLVGTEPRPQSILVVGSGGAARAVLFALKEQYQSARVEVASRKPDAAQEELQSLLAPFASSNCIDPDTAAKSLADFDLVIQATPVGSFRQPGLPLPEPLVFRKGTLVIDLIYAPRMTRFLEHAQASGAILQNGLPMLIGQAAKAFRSWTGKAFPLDKAMHELLPQLTRS